MELMILIPVFLLMGGVAIALALNEKPVPALSAPLAGSSPARITPISLEAARSLNAAAHETNAGALTSHDTALDIDDNDGRPTLSQTDVLLADALTEMIGLKAEIYRLRSKVDSLNVEVAKLSGPPNPTPPAASRRPVQLRRVA